MKWFFQTLPPAQVESEITQRDQFRNDSVSLCDTIVREAVQNSLDAALPDQRTVKVTFRWLDISDGLDAEYFENLHAEQRPHARAAGVDVDSVQSNEPRALVIEDFGTRGLTGSIDSKDNDNFSDFWRRHGKSHKEGGSRGRWGLGKLVYSTASELRVFYGYTRRKDDSQSHLMGQSVLSLYELDGKQYQPHSFFADQSAPSDPDRNLPVPLQDLAAVETFQEKFSLHRAQHSGLSIVIPYPERSIQPHDLTRIAIENYFFPLVSGQLELAFDDTEISTRNVRALARMHSVSIHDDTDVLFDFIEAVTRKNESEPSTRPKDCWADDSKLDADDFEPDDIERLQKRFASGEVCSLRLPLVLKRRRPTGKQLITTYVDVHLQRPDGLQSGMDLYVRGGLTLPGERKFKSRRALGLVIAEDESICDFLGDAENPAHTKWTLEPEKLRAKYVAPKETVRVVRQALVNFYDMLCESEQERDESGLADFFLMNGDDANGGRGSRRTSTPPSPRGKTPPRPNDIPTKPKLITVHRSDGGFTLSTTEAISESLPLEYTITVAYDDGSANPSKNYHPLDFRLDDESNIALQLNANGNGKQQNDCSAKDNRACLTIRSHPCVLRVFGFDKQRDLKVKLRKGKICATDDHLGEVA